MDAGFQHAFRTFVAISALLSAPLATAQTTYTWTGSESTDWNTSTNWNPGGVPNSQNASLVFGPATRTSVTLSIPGFTSAGTITFPANAPAYTITLSGALDTYPELELFGGLVNQSTTTQPHFVTAAQANLALGNGTFDKLSIDNFGGVTLLTAGGGSDITNSTIVNESGGGLYFEITNGTNPPSAGTTNVSNNAGALIDMSESIEPIAIGSLNGAGRIFLGAQTLTLGGLNQNNTITGVIADGGVQGGTGGAVTKTGSGTLILSGNNTYTGKTTVASGSLDVEGNIASSPEALVVTGAKLTGAGSIGTLTAQAGSVVVPGNAAANSKLSAANLFCASSPNVILRIGNIGSSTHGTYLSLDAVLQSAFCPHLHLKFTSAGVPLVAGQAYLVAIINGSTNYSAGNLDYDFFGFPGYPQASGHFLVSPSPSFSNIFFILDNAGDSIFRNGFELFN